MLPTKYFIQNVIGWLIILFKWNSETNLILKLWLHFVVWVVSSTCAKRWKYLLAANNINIFQFSSIASFVLSLFMFTYVAGEAGRVTPHSALHSQMNNTQGLFATWRQKHHERKYCIFHSNTSILILIELYWCWSDPPTKVVLH